MFGRPSVLVFALVASASACGGTSSGAASPTSAREMACAAEFRRVDGGVVDDDVRAGRFDAALQKTAEALHVCERDLGTRHVATSRVRVRRAWVMEKAGEHRAASEQAELALSVFERDLGEPTQEVASALQVMASAAIDAKDYPRAKTLTLRLVSLRERIGPPDGVAAQLGNLGLVYLRLGQKADALDALKRALAIARKSHPEGDRTVALAMSQLGEVYRLQGDLDAAEPLLVDSLGMFERVLGPDDAFVASAANNLAALYHYGRRDLAKAEPLYRRALGLYKAHFPPGHVYAAQTLMNLGTLLVEKGRRPEGKAMFDEGIAQMEAIVGRDAPEVRHARAYLGKLLDAAP